MLLLGEGTKVEYRPSRRSESDGGSGIGTGPLMHGLTVRAGKVDERVCFDGCPSYPKKLFSLAATIKG